MKDDLYQKIKGGEGSFRFDASVVEVFDDMIRRSVPGYGLTLEMIGVVAQKAFGEKEGIAYDLGCSLGASMFPILASTQATVIGVDLSSDMLSQANKNLGNKFSDRYELRCEDLSDFQFDHSARLISLEPGGVFLMSEKFISESTANNNLLIDLHHTFKATQGYSEMEIARKRDAIDNVLIPETSEIHLSRLRNLGFDNPVCWYQCFNFASFLAIK